MILRTCTTLTILAAAAFSQTAGAPPSFDVASIKASQGRRGGMDMLGLNAIQVTPGSFTMWNSSLKTAIGWAYGVFEYQITGPGWAGEDRYDIVAKSAGPVSRDQLRSMLQSLLAERFKLAIHRETKEMQAYVLSVGKNGPKFSESKTEGDSDVTPDPKRMVVEVHRVDLRQLVHLLATTFQTPVIDQTGLRGRYDVSIDVTKYIPQSGERANPLDIIQTGLQQELGLKLESKKMPVDLLIIDHAEKAPVEN